MNRRRLPSLYGLTCLIWLVDVSLIRDGFFCLLDRVAASKRGRICGQLACSVALFLCTWLAPAAYAGDDVDAGAPEEYETLIRHEEDWSGFDPAQSDDFFAPIKHIDLTDPEVPGGLDNWWLSLGGSVRLRYEGWENFLADADNDAGFLLARGRVHADLRRGERFRAYVEVMTAQATARDLPGGRRVNDVDDFNMHQAFIDLVIAQTPQLSIMLRPGRQSLAFGESRLIGRAGWRDSLWTWDGITAQINAGDWTITPLWVYYVPPVKYGFDYAIDTQLLGVYNTGPLADSGLHADTYFLGWDEQTVVTFNGTTGEDTRYTVGGRLFGELNDQHLSFDIEAAHQFGKVGSQDVNAYMLSAELVQAFPERVGQPTITLGFDYASGDDKPGGTVNTWNRLRPLGHTYFGAIDLIGRQNLIAVNTQLEVAPTDQLELRAQLHGFFRADTDDALYNAGGRAIVAGGTSDSRYAGTELDLRAQYQLDRHTMLELGYSRFFAGSVLDDGLTRARDIDFVYLQLKFIF